MIAAKFPNLESDNLDETFPGLPEPFFFPSTVSAHGNCGSGRLVVRHRIKTWQGLTAPGPRPCVACIRAHMEFLASDALRGRGSGTTDELVAATYVASQLRAYGITPAGDDGGYLQRATLLQPKFTAPPQLSFAKPGAGGEKVAFNYGKEFTVGYLSQAQFSGRLRVINADEKDPQVAGAIVLILGNDRRKQRAMASTLAGEGAVAALIAVNEDRVAHFAERAKELPAPAVKIEGMDTLGIGTRFQSSGDKSGCNKNSGVASRKYDSDFRRPFHDRKEIHMECSRHPARQ